ncbi:MAG TPA: DUF2130 domain-containing protein, partial [Candidatus Izemoplasmatales bacterium]|nr:DUF2130 domain-containing protein [Candidatus Izemoplasmatales bacterium]
MAKINEVLIVNAHTLKLNQDAKKGDEIDLRSLNSVDMRILQNKIDEKLDQEYNKRLKAYKEKMLLEKKNEIQVALKQSEKEIIELKEKIKSVEVNVKTQLSSQYTQEINQLKHQIEMLAKEKETILASKDKDISLSVSKKVEAVKDQLHGYQKQIDQLKHEKAMKEEQLKMEKQIAVQAKEKELNDRIQEKENIISRLSLEKSNLNIKKMGEELESWIDQEFQNHALNGFDTCTWYKDNEAVKSHGESRGTKADYIFKVYSNSQKDNQDLLTSVACEIKSEDPNSTYKKKNADHYEKLDKDRQKKACEYALLISELEWDSPNDAPIRKVQNYKKMYMVRPPYFMVFLNILTAITLRYREIINQYQVEKRKFKDVEDIIHQFDDIKNDLLEKSIKYIQKKMKEIVKSADSIKHEANNIL